MNSDTPKPLIPLKEKPMIKRLVDTLKLFPFIDICVIVGHKAEKIKKYLGDDLIYVFQNQQRGTADAVQKAQTVISRYKNILILPADAPMLSSESIQKLYDSHIRINASCSFFTSTFPFNLPYARVVRKNNSVVDCIEEIDTDNDTFKINELFTSHYLINSSDLSSFIKQIKPHKLTGEYHLTEIIKFLYNKKCILNDVHVDQYQELMGINTKEDLNFIESWIESDAP